jgi:hypothetical protein
MADEIITIAEAGEYRNSIWCEFSEPVNLGTELSPDWQYSKALCDNPQYYEHIENATTEASFWVDKTFSYGDFFIIGLLTIFLLTKIVEIIWNKFIEN